MGSCSKMGECGIKDSLGDFKLAVVLAIESIGQTRLRRRRRFSIANWAMNHCVTRGLLTRSLVQTVKSCVAYVLNAEHRAARQRLR
jgi:hypothetical protein